MKHGYNSAQYAGDNDAWKKHQIYVTDKILVSAIKNKQTFETFAIPKVSCSWILNCKGRRFA